MRKNWSSVRILVEYKKLKFKQRKFAYLNNYFIFQTLIKHCCCVSTVIFLKKFKRSRHYLSSTEHVLTHQEYWVVCVALVLGLLYVSLSFRLCLYP